MQLSSTTPEAVYADWTLLLLLLQMKPPTDDLYLAATWRL